MATGLQAIVNYCNGIAIDRRKVVGIQYTRNEIPRVSQTPTKNPWRITLDMPKRYRYSEARELLESLDRLDRITPQVVSFSDNPNLSWIFRYQGQLSAGQISGITVQSYIGDQLVLTGLPPVGVNTVLFEPNDLIQIGSNYYPFTSVNQVLRGGGSTVTLTTSRPNIITSSVVGQGITVGNTCKFTMFCPNMPTYKLVVGGLQVVNGERLNNALIEFDDKFNLYEFVGTA